MGNKFVVIWTSHHNSTFLLDGLILIISLNELKNLGEYMLHTVTFVLGNYLDKYSAAHIERAISTYQQKFGFYSSEIQQILEETRSLALEWYKNIVDDKEYELYRLEGQIKDQIRSSLYQSIW